MADIRKDQERDELHRAIWADAAGCEMTGLSLIPVAR